MYMVLGLYNQNGNISYAVQVDGDVEVITELELKLLVSYNLTMVDSVGKPIRLSGDNLICNVPDVTDELNSQLPTDEDYEGYEDYFDDYDEDNSSDEDEDYEDEYSDYDEYDDSDDEDIDDDNEDYEDLYEDYEEEEEPEESTVSKLYKFLSDEQRTVLKRYYIWYSQRLFSDAQKDPTLGMKSQKALMRKKSDLNNLRKSGGLWHYAGFVDMGRRGDGYCTLGHPLRFMHLAWDVTESDIDTAFFGEDYDSDFEEAIESSNCIKFGIKCVADFFEVDSECVRALQRAQRESLKDMALMYEYYANGTVDKVLQEFKFTSDLMKEVSTKDAMGIMVQQNYKPIVRKELSSFYIQFEKLNMIPPKSLVQEIRDELVGWKGHVERQGHLKKPDDAVIKQTLKSIVGKDSEKVVNSIYMFSNYLYYTDDYRRQIICYIYILLMYESCGFYKYNADKNNEEGGSSKRAKTELDYLYLNGVANFFSDVEFSVSYLKKLCQLYSMEHLPVWDNMFCLPMISYDKDGLEYLDESSVRPVDNLIPVYDEETGSNFESAYNFYHYLRGAYRIIKNPHRLIKERNNDTKLSATELLDLFKVNRQIFDEHYEKFKDWYRKRCEKSIAEKNEKLRIRREEEAKRAEELRKEREARELEAKKQRELEETESKVEEQVEKTVENNAKASEIKTVQDVMNYINTVDLSKLDKKFDFHKTVLSSVNKSGKEPSPKQFYYMKALYKELSGVDFGEDNTPKIEKVNLSERKDIQDRVDYILAHKDEFKDIVYSIAQSVKKYGNASEKQLKYIMEDK